MQRCTIDQHGGLLRLFHCLRRVLDLSALLPGDAQVEPALEMIGRVFHQLFAVASRRVEFTAPEGAGGQALERGLRERAQLQQPLGEFRHLIHAIRPRSCEQLFGSERERGALFMEGIRVALKVF